MLGRVKSTTTAPLRERPGELEHPGARAEEFVEVLLRDERPAEGQALQEEVLLVPRVVRRPVGELVRERDERDLLPLLSRGERIVVEPDRGADERPEPPALGD